MAAFLWAACPLLVKEMDCGDGNFLEGPIFPEKGYDQ